MASCRQVSSQRHFTTQTILFQHDTRLICDEGHACKLFHQTHALGRQHAELFIHADEAVLAVQAGAVAGTTVVRNGLAATVTSIPGIAFCWAISPSEVRTTLAGTAAMLDATTTTTTDTATDHTRSVHPGAGRDPTATAVEATTARPPLLVPPEPTVGGPACATNAPPDAAGCRLPPDLVRRGGADGSVAFIYVHGFRQRYRRIVNVGEHIRFRLARQSADRSGDPDGGAPVFVTFAWPSQSRKTQYGRARAASAAAGTRLRHVVVALRRCGFKRVVMLGHSLGTRVVLNAALAAPPEARIDHLILMGAAVATDSLASAGEFPRGALAADEVTVIFSRRDNVLGRSFEMGEAFLGGGGGIKALGRHGPSCSVAGVAAVDVTASVPHHNPNVYLLSPLVISVLEAAMTHRRVDSADAATEIRALSDLDAAVLRQISTESRREEDESCDDLFAEAGDDFGDPSESSDEDGDAAAGRSAADGTGSNTAI
jgi:pimeloyl-ACP methyl ester carboxylesterase